MNNVNSLAHVCLLVGHMCVCVCVLSACCKPEGRDCDGATAALPLGACGMSSRNRLMNLLTSWRLACHLPRLTSEGTLPPSRLAALPPFVLQTAPHIYLLLAATNFRKSCWQLPRRLRQQRFICCLLVCCSSFFIARRRLLVVVIWLLLLMLLVLPLLLLLSFICRHQLFARITRATLKFY